MVTERSERSRMRRQNRAQSAQGDRKVVLTVVGIVIIWIRERGVMRAGAMLEKMLRSLMLVLQPYRFLQPAGKKLLYPKLPM